jgi:hypothetical protein
MDTVQKRFVVIQYQQTRSYISETLRIDYLFYFNKSTKIKNHV